METLSINDQEQQSLDHYIKSHNTAVLTIMFTDIEGYTQITEEQGDQIANELREKHDSILKGVIEKNDVGLILKFIGDAVMAIFAEPSAAIERAIKIQESIRKFNQQNNALPDIKVRIGLHMGQITIEDNVQTDIFGRHVNRAARIEGLAKGGQILMSYSVFDSAQGWIISQSEIDNINHGFYQLKGISSPVEIFEVFEKEITTPETPTKGKIKNHSLIKKLLTGASALIFGVLLTFFIQQYKKVELYLENFYPENMYLSDNTKLTLAGKSKDTSRLVTNTLTSGHHLIYYAVGKNLRYYSELDLKRGENRVKLHVKEWRLPTLQYRLRKSEVNNKTYIKAKNFKLLILNGKLMTSVTANLTVSINRAIKDNIISNKITWAIEHNDQALAKGTKSITQKLNAGVVRLPKEVVWKSKLFNYNLSIYTGKGALDFKIQGQFTH